MARQLPPLTWFRSFDAAARHLNFTAAAREVGLTQSAISQQIRAMETRLGVPLFRRHARGIELTDDGRKLLPKVASAIETLTVATSAFDLAPGRKLLNVAASVSIIQWLISPALAQFCSAHPDMPVRLRGMIWPDDFSMLAGDVEIRFGSADQAGRNAVELFPHELIVVKSPELDGDIFACSLIEAVGVSDGWRNWTAAAGIEGLQPMLYADSYGMAMQLALDVAGIALVHSGLARPLLQSDRLVQVHPCSITTREGYFISCDEENQAAMMFRDWIIDLTTNSART